MLCKRQRLAPMPTGSSTVGCPRAEAARPQARHSRNFVSSGVPVLRTEAAEAAVISSASGRAWAMMGLGTGGQQQIGAVVGGDQIGNAVDQGTAARRVSSRVTSGMMGIPPNGGGQMAARMDFMAPLRSRENTRMPASTEPPTVDTRKGTT